MAFCTPRSWKKRTYNTRFHIYFNHRLYTYKRLGFLFAINRGLNIGDAFCVTPGCYARAAPILNAKFNHRLNVLFEFGRNTDLNKNCIIVSTYG